MKFEISYTIKNVMKVFTDVVEGKDCEEAEQALKKLVAEIVGKTQVQIIFIKSI